MVIYCQLSVVSCQLSVVSCQLSVVSCQLSVVSCQLSVVSCQLSVVSCQLSQPADTVDANRSGKTKRQTLNRLPLPPTIFNAPRKLTSLYFRNLSGRGRS